MPTQLNPQSERETLRVIVSTIAGIIFSLLMLYQTPIHDRGPIWLLCIMQGFLTFFLWLMMKLTARKD